VTPRVKAFKGTKWRKKMIDHMRGKFAKLFSKRIQDIFSR
jgi:hypothetical protein